MIERWLLALALLGNAAGARAWAGPDLVRRVQLLYPGSYQLKRVGKQPGTLKVMAPGQSLAPAVLDRPGSAVTFTRSPADPGSSSTWELAFEDRNGSLDLELSDPRGMLRIPFRVSVGPAEPRLRAAVVPGAFDTADNNHGRSYYVKGPVTIVGTTGDGEVLIAVGR